MKILITNYLKVFLVDCVNICGLATVLGWLISYFFKGVPFYEGFWAIFALISAANTLCLGYSFRTSLRYLNEMVKKIGLPRKDIAEGMIKYGFSKISGFSEWNAEDFRKKLESARKGA